MKLEGREAHLSTRIQKKYANKIRELANARGESLSTLFRRALLRELGRFGRLDDQQREALEEQK